MTANTSLTQLAERYQTLEASRRELQEVGSMIGRRAKSAIFSLQREDLDQAEALFKEISAQIKKGRKLIERVPRIAQEGSWRAGLEEYAEARLFMTLMHANVVKIPQEIADDVEIVLGGLSDSVGELVRFAIRQATQGRLHEVQRIFLTAEHVVQFITSLDLTGSLRAKGDQARQHLRKLEDVRYDVSKRTI